MLFIISIMHVPNVPKPFPETFIGKLMIELCVSTIIMKKKEPFAIIAMRLPEAKVMILNELNG
jgi:hypothetical protein